jgi:hypothetical protein
LGVIHVLKLSEYMSTPLLTNLFDLYLILANMGRGPKREFGMCCPISDWAFSNLIA